MKTFIVVALLVAAVAGQSTMDLLKLNKDTKSMLKFDRPVYPMVRDFERNNMIDTQNYHKYTGEFDYDTTTVYTLEEIMSHPLFREYMNLPIFRQFWEYPMFQKYVASIYFQRFWEIPHFQQYFMSPALFYKYIYPIVQLFKYEQTTMNTFQNGDWIWNKNAYNTYPYNTYAGNDYYYGQQYDMVKNIPTICQYNQVYCKALLEKMYTHMYTTMMMPYGQQEEMNMEYPFHTTTTTSNMYNPYVNRMIQGYYNRYPTFQTEKMTPYMFNKERMYNNMFNKERMYNNVHFNKDMYMNTYETTPQMVDDVIIPTTESRFENIRPMFTKTFDRKFMPETMIKA